MSDDERDFEYMLPCPCGTTLRADSEDAIVEMAFAHLRERHPNLVGDYEREHIVFMTVKLAR